MVDEEELKGSEDAGMSTPSSISSDMLSSYIIKVYSATTSADTTTAVATKLQETLMRRETIEILVKFTNGGESSVLFVEDATSSGGQCKKVMIQSPCIQTFL